MSLSQYKTKQKVASTDLEISPFGIKWLGRNLNGWEGIRFKTVTQARNANSLYITLLPSLKIRTC